MGNNGRVPETAFKQKHFLGFLYTMKRTRKGFPAIESGSWRRYSTHVAQAGANFDPSDLTYWKYKTR